MLSAPLGSLAGVPIQSLSAAQARRIALVAQGFGRAQTPVGTRQLVAALDRLAVLQLDSVNVFERSHYLPLFARLGAYDKADLDRVIFDRRSKYTEYWAHQASVIHREQWPLWRWSMAHWRTEATDYGRWGAANGEMLQFLRDELAQKGPLTAAQVEHDANRRKGPWWGWSDVKTGLETLFMWGEVTSAGRSRFERTYDLVERRLPAEIIDRKVAKPDAVRELVSMSTRALGVGTQRDIADYFRLKLSTIAASIRELEESGEIIPVAVEGWGKPAWLHRDARVPRRIEAAALLSPFDPVVWERARTERMYGFHYRIEIYTPEPKRIFGYYSLPVLLDDALVGRIDLKTDRQAGVLRVQSAWTEPDARPDVTRIADLVRQTATWQHMDRVEVVRRGDLASALAAELGLAAT